MLVKLLENRIRDIKTIYYAYKLLYILSISIVNLSENRSNLLHFILHTNNRTVAAEQKVITLLVFMVDKKVYD